MSDKPHGLDGKPLRCEVCKNEDAVGVACVPGVPMSVAYGAECLKHGADPFDILRANILCALSSETAHRWNDPEVIRQDYIDALNTYVDGKYMPFRQALEAHPPTKEELLAFEAEAAEIAPKEELAEWFDSTFPELKD